LLTFCLDDVAVMRRYCPFLLVAGLPLLAAGAYLLWRPASPPETLASTTDTVADADLLVGKTQPVPGRSARIAPTVLHPVVEVLVKPGDRVKKDQPLVRLDEDEPKADLAAKQGALALAKASLAKLKAEPREEEIKEATAALHVAEVNLAEARRYLERIRPGFEHGVVSEQRYHEAKANLSKAEAEQRQATARLLHLQKRPFAQEVAEAEGKIAEALGNVKVAEAELEHYTVVAPIDGIISWLDVNLGTVSRPGTTVWGEILDLSEIDVRCEVSSAKADRLRLGQTAEVYLTDEHGPHVSGKVALISIAADPKTGLVPVVVRLPHPDGRLRCCVPVKVRFR
jgi:multidrug resistance efflux pump